MPWLPKPPTPPPHWPLAALGHVLPITTTTSDCLSLPWPVGTTKEHTTDTPPVTDKFPQALAQPRVLLGTADVSQLSRPLGTHARGQREVRESSRDPEEHAACMSCCGCDSGAPFMSWWLYIGPSGAFPCPFKNTSRISPPKILREHFGRDWIFFLHGNTSFIYSGSIDGAPSVSPGLCRALAV